MPLMLLHCGAQPLCGQHVAIVSTDAVANRTAAVVDHSYVGLRHWIHPDVIVCDLSFCCCCLQDLSRRLLAEQNAEYEASLAADREREARRQEEARKAEEDAKQRAEEEARVR